MDTTTIIMNTDLTPPPKSTALSMWINLFIASLAMVATLPGRTFGLGIITEPLLADLHIDKIAFGWINLWSTLIGAAFAVLAGPVIDRMGLRIALTLNAILLGASVLAMSHAHSESTLVLTLTLARGLGQSALSVVAIAIVGKSFVRNINLAMAIFSVVLSIGFAVAAVMLEHAVADHSWRVAWAAVGWSILVGLALLAIAFVRTPETLEKQVTPTGHLATDHSLAQALATPIFWAVALACAAFNLIFSGITLFAQAILKERNIFDPNLFATVLAILFMTGLLANFIGGFLSSKMSVQKLLALGMLTMTASLLILPFATAKSAILLFAALMGLAGGVVTVVFFAAWPKLFGRTHLGKIQGVAQLLTVLFSAAGPLITAFGQNRQGTFSATFLIMAPILAALALACWLAPSPKNTEIPQAIPQIAG